MALAEEASPHKTHLRYTHKNLFIPPQKLYEEEQSSQSTLLLSNPAYIRRWYLLPFLSFFCSRGEYNNDGKKRLEAEEKRRNDRKGRFPRKENSKSGRWHCIVKRPCSFIFPRRYAKLRDISGI